MSIFSGLFQAPSCCICGNKAGLLTRYKLRDDSYICGSCADLCSPELTQTEYAKMDVSNVQDAINLHQQRVEWYRNDFVTSCAFRQGGNMGSEVLAVDELHSLFANTRRSEPEAFPLSAITGHSLRLETEDLDKDDRDDAPSSMMGGLVDLALGMATGAPELTRRDFPRCPPGQKVKDMYLILYVNVPYMRAVKLPMISAAFPRRADVEDGYRLADHILTYLEELQASMNTAQETAAASQVDSQAGTAQTVATQAANINDAAEALKKLKELLDTGILTQEEFDAKKKQILGL